MTRDRVVFAAAALVAWLGTLTRIFHDWFAHPAGAGLGHGLFGPYQAGLTGSLQVTLDNFSYFTYWSNIAVALTMTVLVISPAFDRTWFRTARNTAAVMIIMTGFLYLTLIAGTDVVKGELNVLITYDVHYVSPIVATIAWLVSGPRGWFTWSESLKVYVVPLVYLVYTLARGSFTHVYPYDFFDVRRYGYQSVIETMFIIVVGAYAMVTLFVIADRLLTRQRDRRRVDASMPLVR